MNSSYFHSDCDNEFMLVLLGIQILKKWVFSLKKPSPRSFIHYIGNGNKTERLRNFSRCMLSFRNKITNKYTFPGKRQPQIITRILKWLLFKYINDFYFSCLVKTNKGTDQNQEFVKNSKIFVVNRVYLGLPLSRCF